MKGTDIPARKPAWLRAYVRPKECWGRVVAEDSGAGACALCVELCPEVFEKPSDNSCARVRPHFVPLLYRECVYEAAKRCPVDAIRITEGTALRAKLGKGTT